MKRVLALQHAWECPLGLLGEILEEQHIPYDAVQVAEEALPDPLQYGAIIALGGSQHVYDTDSYPYLLKEKELIRTAIEQELPYLGICLGGQLLADVLGGSVKRDSSAEIGFYDIPFTVTGQQDPLFRGLPDYQKVFHWHEDSFDLPSGSTLLATNATTKNQAFRYSRCAYGLQYHIELNSQLFDLWLEYPEFKQAIIATVGDKAYREIQYERPIQYQTYSDHTSILFENFLRIAGLREVN